MTRPTIDQPAPPFECTAHDGGTIRLEALRGRHVVLYFYPKDNTPGCTREGQDFRDLHAQFQAKGAEVIGVSRDSARTHQGFATRHGLPFLLLADRDETLCGLYDVIRQKKMYGKDVRGIERSTFLIDRDGVLRRQWRKVKVDGHADEVLAAIDAL